MGHETLDALRGNQGNSWQGGGVLPDVSQSGDQVASASGDGLRTSGDVLNMDTNDNIWTLVDSTVARSVELETALAEQIEQRVQSEIGMDLQSLIAGRNALDRPMTEIEQIRAEHITINTDMHNYRDTLMSDSGTVLHPGTSQNIDTIYSDYTARTSEMLRNVHETQAELNSEIATIDENLINVVNTQISEQRGIMSEAQTNIQSALETGDLHRVEIEVERLNEAVARIEEIPTELSAIQGDTSDGLDRLIGGLLQQANDARGIRNMAEQSVEINGLRDVVDRGEDPSQVSSESVEDTSPLRPESERESSVVGDTSPLRPESERESSVVGDTSPLRPESERESSVVGDTSPLRPESERESSVVEDTSPLRPESDREVEAAAEAAAESSAAEAAAAEAAEKAELFGLLSSLGLFIVLPVIKLGLGFRRGWRQKRKINKKQNIQPEYLEAYRKESKKVKEALRRQEFKSCGGAIPIIGPVGAFLYQSDKKRDNLHVEKMEQKHDEYEKGHNVFVGGITKIRIRR